MLGAAIKVTDGIQIFNLINQKSNNDEINIECVSQACKCAGNASISGNFARASPNALEAMILIVLL